MPELFAPPSGRLKSVRLAEHFCAWLIKVQVPERQVDGAEGLPERGGHHGEQTMVCATKKLIHFSFYFEKLPIVSTSPIVHQGGGT